MGVPLEKFGRDHCDCVFFDWSLSLFSIPHTVLCRGVMGGEIQAVEHIVRSLSAPPLSPDVVLGKVFPLLRSSEVEASGHYLPSWN